MDAVRVGSGTDGLGSSGRGLRAGEPEQEWTRRLKEPEDAVLQELRRRYPIRPQDQHPEVPERPRHAKDAPKREERQAPARPHRREPQRRGPVARHSEGEEVQVPEAGREEV